MTTRRYGKTHVGYRDYAQSTSLNFERIAYLLCPISDLQDREGWAVPTVFNLSETGGTEDEEDKGDRAQCCSPYLAPC
jgi:hypothetical protein